MTRYKASSRTLPKKELKDPKVLAVDPGFDRLGVAIMSRRKNSSKETLLFSTCITTSAKQTKSERLNTIGEQISSIIAEWQPDQLAVETLFFNQNISSAIGVAEARGVILYLAEKNGLEVYEYSPQAIKIAVTGYGKATKPQIQLMVSKLIDIREGKVSRLDDEIDAIALGITHLSSTRSNYPHKLS